jgi:hypothetical protein
VIAYLLRRIDRSFAAAEKIVARLDGAALSNEARSPSRWLARCWDNAVCVCRRGAI